MSEVADQTVHTSGGTTRLVDRIEEAGLVGGSACPSDRRAIHVEMTEQGERALAEALGDPPRAPRGAPHQPAHRRGAPALIAALDQAQRRPASCTGG